jgi:hypothetical protein
MRARQRFGVAVWGLAALAVLLGGVAPARAGLLQVTFHETGFSDVTIIDNMTGDLNPALNQILALIPSTFTDYSGSVIVSSNNPGVLTPTPLGSLTVNPNVTAQTAGANPLIITATQTGFTLPGVAGSTEKFTSDLAVSGLTSGTIGLTGSIDSTSTIPQSLSAPGMNVQTLNYLRGATYSLTAQSSILLTGVGDSSNYSATVKAAEVAPPPPSAVPEPSTLALLALGGGALAGWRRWRKRALV